MRLLAILMGLIQLSFALQSEQEGVKLSQAELSKVPA
jgi:hypothetical protein